MSFRNTLDDIQSNATDIASNDGELLLLQTTTEATGSLADLVGNIPAASFPAALQNANTDVTFSGDHQRYTDRAAFDADTTTEWHIGDTATIGMAIYFYIGTEGATAAGAPDTQMAFTTVDNINVAADTNTTIRIPRDFFTGDATSGTDPTRDAEVATYVMTLVGKTLRVAGQTTPAITAASLSGTGSNDNGYSVNVQFGSAVAITGIPARTTMYQGGAFTPGFGPIEILSSAAMFLEDNFLELNGITTVALNDVTDVNISSAMDNQVLTYDAASMRWTNQGLPAGATITTSSEAYTISTTNPGMSMPATYLAGSFTAITGGGGTGTAATIASQHTLYYNGLALIQGLDYTVADGGTSVTVLAASQAEFEAGTSLILVNVVVSSS